MKLELSERLGQLLVTKNWFVTTAESCTGGGISTAITEVAGCSAYFEQAFVTYSNDAKAELVGVSQDTLAQFGAVSKQTVTQMAEGALIKAQANIAIAVSGIAGPSGGTELKPVGTVWIGIALRDSNVESKSTVWSQCYQFDGDRKSIREETIKAALIKACELIETK